MSATSEDKNNDKSSADLAETPELVVTTQDIRNIMRVFDTVTRWQMTKSNLKVARFRGTKETKQWEGGAAAIELEDLFALYLRTFQCEQVRQC